MSLPETWELRLTDGRVLRYGLHGPKDGHPTIFHGGTPSSRWKRPWLIDAIERSELRLLIYDRPGYGGSTRDPGRDVAKAAADTAALADDQGWSRFGVFGGSGGGPHALACAALLADRVTRCAVLSSIKPSVPPNPAPSDPAPSDPARDETDLRARLTETAATIMSKVEAGGPEFPGEPGPPAREDPDALARLRATFVDSTDGWVDDKLAFARPWGFDPSGINVPVGVWRGTNDETVPAENAEWLLTHVPGAEGHIYTGGHLPGPDTYTEIYTWLRNPR